MLKKGYIYIILFSLFTAISKSLYYRIYINQDLTETTLTKLILQAVILFLIVLIPGLLVVRWYYKMKNK
jgi:hypothetical protein